MNITATEHTTAAQTAKVVKPKKPRFKWLKRGFLSMVAFILLVVGGFVFMLTTEIGAQFTAFVVNKTLNRFVTIGALEGRLSSRFSAHDMVISLGDKNAIRINSLSLDWDLWRLFHKKIAIHALSVDTLVVDIQEKSTAEKKASASGFSLPLALSGIQIPIDVSIEHIAIANSKVILPNDLALNDLNMQLKGIVFDYTLWQIAALNITGLVHQGKKTSLPVKLEGRATINPQTERVYLALMNTTQGMVFQGDRLDHVVNTKIEGPLNNLTLRGGVTLNWPTMIAKPLVLSLAGNITDQSIIDLDAELLNENNKVHMRGTWQRRAPEVLQALIEFDAPELASIHPEVKGAITGTFSAQGTLKKPLLKGSVNAHALKAFGASLKKLTLFAEHNEAQTTKFTLDVSTMGFKTFGLDSVVVDLDAEQIEQFTTRFALSNLTNNKQTLVKAMTLDLVGSLLAHTLRIKGESIFADLEFSGKGRIDSVTTDPKWTFFIDAFKLTGNEIGRYSLEKPSYLFASKERISLSRLCLNNLPTTFCLEGNRTAERALGSMVLRSLSPALVNSYLPEDVKIDTALDLVLSGRFVDPEKFIGVADLSLRKGKINYKLQGRMVELPLTTTQMKVLANPESVRANLKLDWGDYLKVDGTGVINGIFAEQTITANMTANVPTLKWILPLVPDIQRLEGLISATAKVAGTLKNPELGVQLRLDKGQVYMAEYDSEIKDMNVAIDLKEGTPMLNIKGDLMAGTGKMDLVGVIDLAALNIDVNLKGKDLRLANSELVKVLVNPDLTFTSKKNQHHLSGTLLIPQFNYVHKASDDSRGSVKQSSPDTIIIMKNEKNGQKKKDAMANLSMDFKVVLGDDISVGAMGFIGALSGDLHLTKKVNKPIRALGIINVGRGVYEILGQELSLDKGRVQFSGGAITNPAVEFQASRAFDNKRTGEKVNVGVRVTGNAKRLKLKLFSQPNMPDNSIISYMALGTDAESLTAFETLKIVKMARDVMTGNFVNTKGQKKDDFASKMGVSEVGLIKDLSGNSAFGIGKDITENLYFGLGVGIFEQGAFATLRYKFLKWFNLDSQMGTEHSSFDIRYSREL